MSKRLDGRRRGPLTPYASGFRAELMGRGYGPSATDRHLQLMAHLSEWLDREGLEVAVLATEAVEVFFGDRRKAGYSCLRTPRSVVPLVAYLRRVGALADPVAAVVIDPVETVVMGYRAYLVAERGLVEGTVRAYVRVARLFLSEQAGPDGLRIGELRAGDVVGFAARLCEPLGLSATRAGVSGLRSLLRYLRWAGLTGLSLDQAVLSVAGCSPRLPKAITAAQVQRLLEHWDRDTAIGQRDHAIVLLLARLGLRAAEAAMLELDDIDWSSGEIVVRGKGGRRDRLPLPADVGEAVANYLRHGRPTGDSRRVFLRHYAPIGGFQPGSGVMRAVLARSCRRAGLPLVSPHRLRHTAAGEMLRNGASLGEISQVLRHRSTAATALYAAVDTAALGAVAQPWPAGGEL